MKKKQHTISYSADDVTRLRKDGKDFTNWEHVDRMTKAELAASIDEDDDIGAINWETLSIGLPQRKRGVHIRLDADLLDWLKQNGRGYKTRINAILRSYTAANASKTRNNHTP